MTDGRLAFARIPPGKRRTYKFVLLTLGPVMALFLYLRIIPIAQTFVMSAFDWPLLGRDPRFVGITNYLTLLSDESFRTALFNTVLFALFTCILSVVIALLLAVLLSQFVTGRLGGALELLYFAPVLIPMVPITLAWRMILDYQHGILNAGLGVLGIGPQPWLSDPKLALVSVIVLSTWKQIGYDMIILLVGIRAIPRIYLEAAAIDGAGSWQTFRRITLPLLAPVTLFVIVITTISAFNVFTQVYVLASDVQGAPGLLVPVMVYDIMQNAFRFFNMGYASAEGVYLFAIILVLTIVQFRFLRGSGE